jgi:hypothetical protein
MIDKSVVPDARDTLYTYFLSCFLADKLLDASRQLGAWQTLFHFPEIRIHQALNDPRRGSSRGGVESGVRKNILGIRMHA